MRTTGKLRTGCHDRWGVMAPIWLVFLRNWLCRLRPYCMVRGTIGEWGQNLALRCFQESFPGNWSMSSCHHEAHWFVRVSLPFSVCVGQLGARMQFAEGRDMQPEILVTGYEKQKIFLQVALPLRVTPHQLHFWPWEDWILHVLSEVWTCRRCHCNGLWYTSNAIKDKDGIWYPRMASQWWNFWFRSGTMWKTAVVLWRTYYSPLHLPLHKLHLEKSMRLELERKSGMFCGLFRLSDMRSNQLQLTRLASKIDRVVRNISCDD